MATKTRTFVDLDLNFEPHPSTNDLRVLVDDNAIKRSVRNLIMTHHWERPFHSEIGSSVHGLLFELYHPGIAALLRQEIVDVINNFEPRVIVQDVNIVESPDKNGLDITIVFRIVNTTRPITLNLVLERVR